MPEDTAPHAWGAEHHHNHITERGTTMDTTTAGQQDREAAMQRHPAGKALDRPDRATAAQRWLDRIAPMIEAAEVSRLDRLDGIGGQAS